MAWGWPGGIGVARWHGGGPVAWGWPGGMEVAQGDGGGERGWRWRRRMEEEEVVGGGRYLYQRDGGAKAFVIWPTGNDRAADFACGGWGSTRGGFGLG